MSHTATGIGNRHRHPCGFRPTITSDLRIAAGDLGNHLFTDSDQFIGTHLNNSVVPDFNLGITLRFRQLVTYRLAELRRFQRHLQYLIAVIGSGADPQSQSTVLDDTQGDA